MSKGVVEEHTRLVAALLLCLVFGSIHAYGVLLIPIEDWLSVSRVLASLGYSLAIAALTLGVSVYAVLSRRLQPAAVALICGCLAALGLGLAALGGRPISLLVGYGLVFGLGNGLAYALALNEAARSTPSASAWAMGLATAVYGAGSVIAAQVFRLLLESVSIQSLFLGMALTIAIVCAMVSLFLWQGTTANTSGTPAVWRRLRLSGGIVALWAIYLLGAMGGLMIIAHSAGVMATFPLSKLPPSAAPILVGLGSIAGGYLGGIMASHLSPRACLVAPLFGLAVALTGLFLPSAGLALLLLMFSGLCYGVLISVVPAIVRQSYGDDRFAAAFGLIFTAWGVAGLFGPLFGGWVYDWTGGYTTAVLAAAAQSATAGVVSLVLFSRPEGGRRKCVR